MTQKTTEQTLDSIINSMIEVVINSKDEIIHISEASKKEYEKIVEELKETKESVQLYIDETDKLQKQEKQSRKQLAIVSKEFHLYTEEQVKEAYRNAHATQTKLLILKREEKTLREKRDDLERRLLSIGKTLEKAEGLTSKITVMLKYLQDDFSQVNEIVANAKQKQEFGLKIIKAQEDERLRISREIHDGPAQMLANIKLRTEIMERMHTEGNIQEIYQEIKNVREMVSSSLQEVRHIIYDLRPMALDDLGLVPTIRKYVDNIAEYYQTEIEFNVIGKEKRVQSKDEIVFYRLMQEAVQNALKHAEATLIKVNLEMNDKSLSMVIKDNGKGFNPEEKQKDSFGIIGMKERVDMMGGKLQIVSKKNKGTSIIIAGPSSVG